MRAWLLMLAACGGGGKGGPIDGPLDGGTSVGRVCDLGSTPTMDETVIASPSLDCESRICLHAGGADVSLCTAECTDASQCHDDPASSCEAGYVCAPAVVLGPFACTSFCICADHVPATNCP